MLVPKLRRSVKPTSEPGARFEAWLRPKRLGVCATASEGPQQPGVFFIYFFPNALCGQIYLPRSWYCVGCVAQVGPGRTLSEVTAVKSPVTVSTERCMLKY